MKSILFLLLFGLCLSCCAQEEKSVLQNRVEFESFSTTPLYQKYGNVKAVKVIYHLQNQTLHFINGNVFDFHYEFAQKKFDPFLNLQDFNKNNYSAFGNRNYLLGNINYYAEQNKYVLEIGPSDQLSANHLRLLFDSVKQNTFFGEQLYFFANTNNARKIIAELPNIPHLTPEDIYANQLYQPLHKGQTVGKLRVINNIEKELTSIKKTDILVLNESPLYLPICAGVLISKFQTPLSHISILAKNRKIPVCAKKKLFSMSELISLDGQKVVLTVKQDTFYVQKSKANFSEIEVKQQKLKFDLSVDTLVTLNRFNKKYQRAIGSKAYNFSKLVDYAQEMDFKTPESAFAIPFYFYEQHMQTSGAAEWLELLATSANLDKEEKQKILATIRNKILTHPISADFLLTVEHKIKKLGNYYRLRFRSSTNAEDMGNFSGAGLYNSKTGELGHPTKTISRAIKSVWASTWNEKAYFERELFGLNQTDVKMGILVHRSFPNEEVNGVAITTNLYRKNYIGFVLNLQKGDLNVVNQKDDIVPEQLILYPPNTFESSNVNYDILSHSTLAPQHTLLTKEELQKLAIILEKIKAKYYRAHFITRNYYDFALDLEFKLAHNTRQLYIKQIRPY